MTNEPETPETTIRVICSAGCERAKVLVYGNDYFRPDHPAPSCGNCEAPMRLARDDE